jgi:polyhydroxyalkanoate synthase subunit PhaC
VGETLTPQAWIEAAPSQPGLWWPVWQHWLEQHSTHTRVPPPLGSSVAADLGLGDAPGKYVLQK